MIGPSYISSFYHFLFDILADQSCCDILGHVFCQQDGFLMYTYFFLIQKGLERKSLIGCNGVCSDIVELTDAPAYTGIK